MIRLLILNGSKDLWEGSLGEFISLLTPLPKKYMDMSTKRIVLTKVLNDDYEKTIIGRETITLVINLTNKELGLSDS